VNEHRNFVLALIILPFLWLLPQLVDGRQPESLFRNAPHARQKAHLREKNGEKFNDPYFWLRERGNPDVTRYLKAENAYTRHVMRDTEAFQEKLFKEMVGRIKETDLSVPEKIGPYLYFYRTEKGKQYRIYCRTKDAPEAAEEVLLDENALSVGKSCFNLGAFNISPDHKLLAFSTDVAGEEKYTLQIKDLSTGKLFPETIPNVSTEVEWGNDNRTIFYSTLDEAHRPYRVYRHALGDEPSKDTLIFEEKDDRFSVTTGKTKDDAYLYILFESNTTTEVSILDANKPSGKFRLFKPRVQEVMYTIDHHDRSFFVHTNEGAINFKVMEVPDDNIATPSWRELIPHTPGVRIDEIEMFAKCMAILERRNGLQQIRYYDFGKKTYKDIPFQEPTYSLWTGENHEYNADFLRFHYTSLLTPETVYDFHFTSGKLELRKQKEVRGEFNTDDWQAERIFAVASDGARIPISLVHRKGMRMDGKNPMYLTGYGSYGSSSDAYFSSNRISILQRGFIYATAHIRGGEEMGREWYLDGKMHHKMNTFTDFVACAEHLIAKGYTSPSRLSISGASAGGLLMGAVTNLRPDLWGTVVADVPFVDVINTMLDSSIPLTAGEFEEWGNPENPDDYAYMRAYSPYDNLLRKAYPPILVTAGLNDSRVQYWEPAKYVARLRAIKTDKNLLLLKTNMGQGHAGPSGRYDALHELAHEYAFIFKTLGILHKSAGEN